MKLAIASVLAGSAVAFAPQASVRSSTAINQHIGSGGMADTRIVETKEDEDPRKSISAAPSFEEYLKQRDGGGGAPAAAAPAAAAPAAAAGGGGGDLLGTLSTLEGPGQVWGHEGIPFGHEELDFKGSENFSKFYDALQSTGVANELASGEFTIFALTDPAIETYEATRGPITADVVKMQIVKGKISSADVPTASLESLAGPLNYRYAVRKHFVNDAIIGEKTFGPFADYPIDVACSNGVIHSVGLCFALY
jgi:uncharacterized surface protein with fasciclin (FAS1) repeats